MRDQRAREAQGTQRPSVVLAIACTAVVLSSLDLFIVNVALPQIARSVHGASLADLSWVLNAYAIVFASLLIPAGRLADRTSRKYGFLLGLVLFLVASAACAASTSVSMLVGFRILQAAGAAVLVPTSLGLVLAAFPPERRGAAVRTWTAMGGLAAALGPVVGGLFVAASWRWAFLINVPIGLAALVAGWRGLPDTRGEGGPLPDGLGAGLLTAAISSLIFALVKGNSWGWTSPRVLGLLAASALLGAAFLARSAHHPSPVFELDLLRSRSFAVSTLAALLFSAAFGAMLLSIVLWSQDIWHWSALRTGLAIAPGPLMVPLWSVIAGRLIPRLGPGAVISLGSAVFSLGVLWWAAVVGLQPRYVAEMLGGMIVTGIGVGLTLPTLFSTAATSLPAHRFATGSAVISMVRQIGFAVGVAILVAVIGTPPTASAALTAFQHGWLAIAGVALLGAAAGLLLRRPRPATDDTPALAGAAGVEAVA